MRKDEQNGMHAARMPYSMGMYHHQKGRNSQLEAVQVVQDLVVPEVENHGSKKNKIRILRWLLLPVKQSW
jgi:hypothetical protein